MAFGLQVCQFGDQINIKPLFRDAQGCNVALLMGREV